MPLDAPSQNTSDQNAGTGIFVVETQNEVADVLPKPLTISFHKVCLTNTCDDGNKELGFKKNSGDQPNGNIWLGNVGGATGEYAFSNLFGSANSFPLHSFFSFNPKLNFELASNQTTYLGHFIVMVKPRENSEPRASLAFAFLTPFEIINDYVNGLHQGTLKVEVQDRYESDVALLASKYPELRAVTIGKMIARNV